MSHRYLPKKNQAWIANLPFLVRYGYLAFSIKNTQLPGLDHAFSINQGAMPCSGELSCCTSTNSCQPRSLCRGEKLCVSVLRMLFSYQHGSRYGIFTYIYHKNQPNVGKYSIHGCFSPREKKTSLVPQSSQPTLVWSWGILSRWFGGGVQATLMIGIFLWKWLYTLDPSLPVTPVEVNGVLFVCFFFFRVQKNTSNHKVFGNLGFVGEMWRCDSLLSCWGGFQNAENTGL